MALVLSVAAGGAQPATKPTVSSTGKTLAKPETRMPLFTRDMPFGQAIQILRQSTGRPLNVVVYWKEIADNAGVFQDTPIGVDVFAGLSVRQHLQILLGSLSATSGTKLGFAINRGVIVIASVDRLPKPRKVTRVYDVSDLVAPPSTGFRPGMWGGFGAGMGMRNNPTGMGMSGLSQYGALRSQPGAIRSPQGRTRRR